MNVDLAQHLVTSQFPQWAHLPIKAILPGGWDNRSFRLGEDLLLRFPSQAAYAVQVTKEQRWLPKLAPQLPFAIPEPITLGQADAIFPWSWSVYRWLEGQSLAESTDVDLVELAEGLAHFLQALHRIDSQGAPAAGAENFYRGGPLSVYDAETRQALSLLTGKINTEQLLHIWDKALQSTWPNQPVWVHGDISPGNLLVDAGKLVAVIDFGQLAVGDPACDLVMAWTVFHGSSRQRFQGIMELDADTWSRARGWALWKAAITAASLKTSNMVETQGCWQTLNEVLT